MRYVVIENTPGYLPEGDPMEFDTLEEARDYADSLAEELAEQGYLCTPDGAGGYGCADPFRLYDLGRVIEIIQEG